MNSKRWILIYYLSTVKGETMNFGFLPFTRLVLFNFYGSLILNINQFVFNHETFSTFNL